MTTVPFNLIKQADGEWLKVLSNVKDFMVFNESTNAIRCYVATDTNPPVNGDDGFSIPGGDRDGSPINGSVWIYSGNGTAVVSGYGTP